MTVREEGAALLAKLREESPRVRMNRRQLDELLSVEPVEEERA